MLPLGLVLFTQDLPFPERPMAPMLGRVERKWIGLQRAKACNDSIKRLPESILSIFRLCCGAWCDSKANVAD